MNGISTEWKEMREEETAHFLNAGDHLDRLRRLAEMLRSRGHISEAYYHDMRDSLTYIDNALLIGKRNTATLRNGGNR